MPCNATDTVKKRIGRPCVDIDLETVEHMRTAGLTWAEIARELHVGRQTLLNYRQSNARLAPRSTFAVATHRDLSRDSQRRRGRPLALGNLTQANHLRVQGHTWRDISVRLGVSRSALAAARRRNVARDNLPHQQTLLRQAARFLQANLGQGLTPLEFRDAKELVALITSVHRENGELRSILAKARRRIQDYEAMLRR